MLLSRFPYTDALHILLRHFSFFTDAVAGGSLDWTYAKLGVKYSYAPELRDRGQSGFLLPANQIKPSGEETSDAWYAALMAMQ